MVHCVSLNLQYLEQKVFQNFALSYPQNAHPDYLIPLWPLPWHHPGQCCPVEVRNIPARLQHCFRGKAGGGGGGGRGYL